MDAQHPDRNAQFEHINAKAEACIKRGVPMLSVDTKKELVGNFKNGRRQWQPAGEPELVDVHGVPRDAIGKAIPYGVYDVGADDGFVSVGTDTIPPCLPSRRSRRGGSGQAVSATRTRANSSSRPTTRAAAT